MPETIHRKPQEQRPARLDPLATLPVFFKLGSRRTLLAGSTTGSAWKAELLSAAGSHVDVFAPEPPAELVAVADEAAAGRIVIHERRWRADDFAGAALAVGDIEDDAEAAAFHAAARAAGVPVNLVDRPALCDFQFGSIVNRSPLVVGISTDGAAPVFGQAIRARIETLLPGGFRRWAEAALRWRPAIQERGLPFRTRRSFWERFTARALAVPEQEPDEAERQALFATLEPTATEQTLAHGSVVLVGAGPGNPELLTLKAVRCLQSADVILYDDLIERGVLDFARREARLIHVGKRGHKPSCTQEDINGLLVTLAQEGHRVVRLKGGDPMIFGRAGEEIAALAAHGIPCEVVPGVTAASGAAASLGISLTHRDAARRLQFVTSHARNGQLPTDLDWKALADPAATTAVYMGVKTLPAFAANVQAAGLAGETPVIIIERATWPDERSITGTLATIAAVAEREHVRAPCLILIGSALGLGAELRPATANMGVRD